jgi:glycosyltransferase involved in cell wall biosynthesis
MTDIFVTVGEDLKKRYLAAGIGKPSQYCVIPSPVDLERFVEVRRISASQRTALRATMGIPPSVSLVTAVGLLERRKRFDLAIEKLAPLLRGSNTILLICGEGPQRQELERIAAGLRVSGAVRFAGFVKDLPAIFACSDLLVHTSRVEGVPQVLIQSAAAGLPCVATEVEGLSDIPSGSVHVIDRSGNGLLSASIDALAAGRNGLIDVGALKGWSLDHIEGLRSDFYRRLGQMVSAR